jgi:seryl-tRNA synthetase
LKGQLASIQEEARKQVQAITAELHAKSSLLGEREREAGEVQSRLEAEVQGLQAKLRDSEAEQEKAQVKMTEVCTYRGRKRRGTVVEAIS